MVVSQNPNTYSDVEQVFTAARANGGAKYELPSRGDAVYWRRRAYTYRKLLGRLSASPLTPDIPGPTKWDDVTMTLGEGADANCVLVSFRRVAGVLHPLTGSGTIAVQEATPIATPKTGRLLSDTKDDPLLDAAAEIAQEMDD